MKVTNKLSCSHNPRISNTQLFYKAVIFYTLNLCKINGVSTAWKPKGCAMLGANLLTLRRNLGNRTTIVQPRITQLGTKLMSLSASLVMKISYS